MMRVLLLATVLLLLAAPAAAAQDDAIERAAAALETDTVYIDPAAGSELEAGELRSRIADLDLRIAVLPAGNAKQAAATIAERVGAPGDYAIVAGSSLAAGPSEHAQDAADAAVADNQGANADTVLLDFVDRAAGEGEDGGVSAGALVLLGVGVAGSGVYLASRRRRRREQAERFAEVKDNARDDLVALGDDIRALDIDIEMPGVSAEARADYETAVNAYDRADQRWRLAQRPDDLEPMGEALEEGRWAMTSARARVDGREPPERRSPCFFDPRHGPSTREVEWAPPGGEPRMVPACEADAQRAERGEGEGGPTFREVTVGGQRMPYWAAGPMYAPFMGGFFGAGILPGLAIGTVLGDAWSDTGGGRGGDFGGGDWGGGDFGGGDFGGGDFGG